MQNSIISGYRELTLAIREQIAERSFERPLPLWTKKAIARLLQMSLPTTSTKEWVLLFESSSLVDAMDKIHADGRLLGHFLNLMDDIQTKSKIIADPLLSQCAEILKKTTWIRSIEEYRSGWKIVEGVGAREMAMHQLDNILATTDRPNAVIQNVANAHKTKIGIRRQDRRAWRIYLFMVLCWPSIEISSKDFG